MGQTKGNCHRKKKNGNATAIYLIRITIILSVGTSRTHFSDGGAKNVV